ncbi:MAG: hypothetical protein WCH39_14465 [Schlesneria sp.]
MLLIVLGPGVKPNSWCHKPGVGFDLLPTFCEWAGIEANGLPKVIEGECIALLLMNEGKGNMKRTREELVFDFPHYQSDDGPQLTTLLGNFRLMKFYEDDRIISFDLSKDLVERNGLPTSKPDVAGNLRQRLEKYLADVDAQFPKTNSNDNPNQTPAPAREKRCGKNGARQKAGF